MTDETTNWNIVIENHEYEALQNKLKVLEEENTRLEKENKLLKNENIEISNKVIDSKMFINKDYINNSICNDYLDKKPFYLNYKYRFNNIYVPNNYTMVNNYILDTNELFKNDFMALKEQYIPVSKYL
jgi:hypothetical protein